ncbi:tetratricopeptide repeat protein [Olsenella sp. An188]|uniref:tetratricopeptide repeat protein n=1 Tax=Olsenella sp. An188 TaxID=1965579 RepID=UPI000B37E21A|nr:tetratricopeptide repeat protein [Olsenella sp. An188]OUP38895.1 hypothetical protein B5F23_05350 [Olsenella sp. An188]
MENSTFNVSREDIERIAELSGIDVTFHETNLDYHDEAEIDNANELLKELGKVAFSSGGNNFARFVAENGERIRKLAPFNDGIAELLVLGYKLGISAGSAACMNDLGALYYMGEFVEQDYAKAAKLYEMAMEHGCYQSIVNLGYIYEYGRIGEKDLERAYRCYALAVALAPSCEAVYKLGDMYSRCITGQRDLPKAKALWERSLELADGIVETAQPAVRIAKLLVHPSAWKQGIERDPLRALSLYQQAEIGLRIDITVNGMTYYQRRLDEAIAGQDVARAMVETDGGVLF